MARRLEQDESRAPVARPVSRRVDHSTARAFAAALSALAISSLVVTTSQAALQPGGTIATNSLAAGTISVTDDDEGRSLVELTNMAPGRPEEECIEIVYEGSLTPVILTLAATIEGQLAPFVSVEIEKGTGAGFGDCADFEKTDEVFDGRLSELAEVSPVELGRILNQGDSNSFRFVFELADEEAALGLLSTTNFVWVVTPE